MLNSITGRISEFRWTGIKMTQQQLIAAMDPQKIYPAIVNVGGSLTVKNKSSFKKPAPPIVVGFIFRIWLNFT